MSTGAVNKANGRQQRKNAAAYKAQEYQTIRNKKRKMRAYVAKHPNDAQAASALKSFVARYP